MTKIKKAVCAVLSAAILLCAILGAGAVEPIADDGGFAPEKLEDYYTLINGCTRAALKNYDDTDKIDAVVYSGLDISSPIIIFYIMIFYVSNSVDFGRLTSDPYYSTEIAGKLNDYLAGKGITNSRAEEFASAYSSNIGGTLRLNLVTVGGFTFTSDKATLEKMLDDDCTDFVIAGSVFMLSRGDLNSDGDIDKYDAKIIQKVLSGGYSYSADEERSFVRYSADVNEDGVVDVNDVTALQISVTEK